jgi:SH3 domain protein
MQQREGVDAMKLAAALAMSVLMFSAPVMAKTMYVNDITKISVRTGKGSEHRVITTVSSGDKVDVVGEDSGWSLIRLDEGREGWVFSRLLTDQKPCTTQLAELRQQSESVALPGGAADEIRRLKLENEKLATALTAAESKAGAATDSFETLKQECGQVVKYQAETQRLQTALEQANQRAQTLAAQIDELEKRQIFRWFLSGAGVLLAGLLIGSGLRSKRRRSSLL